MWCARVRRPVRSSVPAHAFAGQLFRQLVDLFAFYMAFPIDDHTGDELAEEAVARAHYERIQQLQLLFFRHAVTLYAEYDSAPRCDVR